MDKRDFLGLYVGIGDIIENKRRIGECIFNLEIFMLPSGKIGAEGVILKITEGKVDFKGKEATFIISGIISRDHIFYITKFTCKITPSSYPKFIVPNTNEIFDNLKI